MDLLGPFRESDSGYKYVLLMIDTFSRYTEAVALRDKEGASIAQAFTETIIGRHGIPHIVQTDNGTEFVNETIRELFERLNITINNSTPYNPASNGKVERANQTIMEKIAKLQWDYGRGWVEVLPLATFAYNICTHRALGMSPFYVLFGRQPRLSGIEGKHIELEIPVLNKRVQQIQERLKGELEHSTPAASHNFEIGDLVWVKIRDPDKLGPKYEGPRVIVELGYKSAQILDPTTNRQTSVHLRDLKACGAALEEGIVGVNPSQS